MRKLMQLFASQSERWCHIYFKLPFPMLDCLVSVRSQLPMLETLRIELWEAEHTATAPMGLFAHAPRLRDFIAGAHVTEKLMTIPWNQLQHLVINRYTKQPKQVLDLLALTSNVEHAQFFQMTCGGSPPTEAPSSVQLRNLRSLIVNFNAIEPLPFMAILHTPKIRELSLVTTTPFESLRPFWAFLSSHGTLEKLALYWDDIYIAAEISFRPHIRNVVHVLEDVKQLRVLELPQSGPTFISKDFQQRFALLDQSGAPNLGPNLQTLLFHHSDGIDFQSFAHTLQSRFPPGSEVTLKTVTILCPQRDLVSTLETFQESVWWDQIRDVGINMQLQASESYAVWW
ncbi:hypothetical protein FIBSPDRAFT_942054 [Athelia psychrophila]|uniref:F-box domain-containing protein n=1 Tax=Athelia psychrophila TaxID=1759441 RepID=A0A167SZY7_9AGAM|nr:hypothetical protein FIBSPDRAFT_942054 [Fibularhizoctonia sp. CBS 109695]